MRELKKKSRLSTNTQLKRTSRASPPPSSLASRYQPEVDSGGGNVEKRGWRWQRLGCGCLTCHRLKTNPAIIVGVPVAAACRLRQYDETRAAGRAPDPAELQPISSSRCETPSPFLAAVAASSGNNNS
jgi:hypothetical protein